MLDGVTLDQLRIFVAAVDEGSFSAAGRKLGRTQSVISQTIANLEGQLGVELFDRSGRIPGLTADGKNLLTSARTIVRDVDFMKARAKGLSGGLESELSIVIDVMFPQEQLTSALKDFRQLFPDTTLHLHVEALGAVASMVLDGHCSMGILGSLPVLPPALERERLLGVPFVTVVGASSSLAIRNRLLTLDEVQAEPQLVLSDRSSLTQGEDFGVQGQTIWRLGDLGAKHAFLRAGLGWGHMPHFLVEQDLKDGRLIRVEIDGPPPGIMPMYAIYRTDVLPGPAARWLIEQLHRLDQETGAP